MTRPHPTAFECAACRLRRGLLESRLRGLREVVDAIAIPIGTRKAKVGSGTRKEYERLIRVRRRFTRGEPQAHGDLRRAWGHLTKQGSGRAPVAQALRSILKSGGAFLSGKAAVS